MDEPHINQPLLSGNHMETDPKVES